MLYVMVCEDRPDSQALRLATRAAHLEFIGTLRDRVRIAGPMLSDDGERMIGSLFVIDADSLDDVRRIQAEDPYTQAGLFGKVTIRPFRQVVPAG
jgi:uncharacterized protein